MEEIKSTDIDTSRFTPEALASMRAQFPGEGAEQLARFLIARNGDVDKASDMLRAHVAWRELNLPVSRESCLAELSKGKMYRHGVDLDGRPVLFWRGALHLPHDRNISEMQNLILFMMQDVSNKFTRPRIYTYVLAILHNSTFVISDSFFRSSPTCRSTSRR
jgi:hypothetical protein